jgi:hypothetical protein
MTTISSIVVLLQQKPGITVAAISEELRITEKSISSAIWRARKGGMNIRICGSLKTQNHPFLYEISDKPDVKISKKGCTGKPNPRCGRPITVDAEEYMASRKHALAAMVKPFRDPMLFLTAGVSP